jgi:hypothetical protein
MNQMQSNNMKSVEKDSACRRCAALMYKYELELNDVCVLPDSLQSSRLRLIRYVETPKNIPDQDLLPVISKRKLAASFPVLTIQINWKT